MRLPRHFITAALALLFSATAGVSAGICAAGTHTRLIQLPAPRIAASKLAFFDDAGGEISRVQIT